MFWFKKKKIVVDCFTNNAGAFQYAPIEKYSKYYPEYWKKLPAKVSYTNDLNMEIPTGTLRVCSGFIELYRNAFTIPLWADLMLNVRQDDYTWQWSHNGENTHDPVIAHNSEQFGVDSFPNYSHLKILSPWFFREKTGVYFHWSEPTWNLLPNWGDKIRILPGVLNFKYQWTTHINLLARKGMGQHLIPYNTPMTVMLPLSEATVEVKNHLVDAVEWKKLTGINNYDPTFVNSYKNRSKCPFSGSIKDMENK